MSQSRQQSRATFQNKATRILLLKKSNVVKDFFVKTLTTGVVEEISELWLVWDGLNCKFWSPALLGNHVSSNELSATEKVPCCA